VVAEAVPHQVRVDVHGDAGARGYVLDGAADALRARGLLGVLAPAGVARRVHDPATREDIVLGADADTDLLDDLGELGDDRDPALLGALRDVR
jgi:hypothetical protein